MGIARTTAAKLDLRRKSLRLRARSHATTYGWLFVGAAVVAFFFAAARGEPLLLSCLHAPMLFLAACCLVSAALAAALFFGVGKVMEKLAFPAARDVSVPQIDSLPILTAACALAVYTPPPGIPRLASHR